MSAVAFHRPVDVAAAVGVQRAAIDPVASFWVEANAGTGKTKVLTDRIVRLLLAGARPDRILCLTFTKAAAAEMRNRLAALLGRWTLIEDAALAAEIEGLDLPAPDSATLGEARRLFAHVLDAPGGVRILTIHAFCQSLLARFPLEAGVVPGATVLDEADARGLIDEARDAQIGDIANGLGEPALADALACVARRVGEREYAEALSVLVGERERLERLCKRHGDVEGVVAAIHADLSVEPGLTAETVRDETWAAIEARATDLRGLVAALAAKPGKMHDEMRGRLEAWLAAPDKNDKLWRGYRDAFLTGKGEPRKNVPTSTLRKARPDLDRFCAAEAERLLAADERARAAVLAETSAALARLAYGVLGRYAALKRARAALDYDDLILRARSLFDTRSGSAWVLYKLDCGIAHVLIDEAQDTNPDQWAIVRGIVEEFHAGFGAEDAPRTLFVVGDAKQSIFSFQRADPGQLDEMFRRFDAGARDAVQPFRRVELIASFRSTGTILEAVDAIFAEGAPARPGVGNSDTAISHLSTRGDQAGLVEVWPLVGPSEEGEDRPTQEPHQRLAQLLARHCQSLIGQARSARDGRLVDAGDIMVLVRRRGAFVAALTAELKQRGVDVAGRDRFRLVEDPAVEDLMALVRAALLPGDDLTLACVLKGPLIGFDEDQLFRLAHGRTGSLWSALRAGAARDAGFARAWDLLSAIFARVDYLSPHDFFAAILGAGRGRRDLVGRLGHESVDAIDEFLGRAADYQRRHPPSLLGFLRWLEIGSGEIKRDLDDGRRRELRILTVHSSKGLQSPIVYLPDTCADLGRQPRVLWTGEDLPLWAFRKDETRVARVGALEAERERLAAAEHHRLLYVALTRAADRLYVAGWHGTRKPKPDSWYHLVRDGLIAGDQRRAAPREEDAPPATPSGVEVVPFDFTDPVAWLGPRNGWMGEGLRLRRGTEAPARDDTAAKEPEAPMPAWIERTAPAEPSPPRPLLPSRPDDEDQPESRALGGGRSDMPVRSPLSPDDARRFQRGNILHRLLQVLPDVEAGDRVEAGRRWLARPGLALDDTTQATWLDEALAVLASPDAAALFGAGSRAEVPIVGVVSLPSGPVIVSGQIDRLAVAADAVLIADFKTNRPPPANPAGVARVYRRQMALYRRIVAEIYPGKTIRCFLVWTDAARCMELPADLMDAALA